MSLSNSVLDTTVRSHPALNIGGETDLDFDTATSIVQSYKSCSNEGKIDF